MPDQCFVIMPFSAELHYFYLYLRHHLQSRHNLICERADASVLTVPLLDKIKDYINRADIIIADCSGRNPNVFYELGIAHTLNKDVILITHDSISEAPSDIRHYEFIRYELSDEVTFLKKLDNALENITFKRYEPYYLQAKSIFDRFNSVNGLRFRSVAEGLFLSSLRDADRQGSLSTLANDDKSIAEFLLPKIIENTTDAQIMRFVLDWLDTLDA
ncbi:MAG: hypothetical protein LCI00_11100 [Chloroflexi bacterium]|nr:hypothetical protein [Chloroflexota bacterium]MCC6891903.1 hypothetical protein [Anaerolineae bacterium]